MKITWLGHSAFRIETGKARILIDPFFTGNPGFAGLDLKEAAADVTHILLTHGHGDHVGDTLAIAKESGATVVANFDLCMWLAHKGLENYSPGNTGGTIDMESFTVTFTNALHSSASITEDGVSHSLGNPNGLMLHFDNGASLLHMGDTDIFSDMALINELHRPDIGIVPIGDRFTMGGRKAATAARRYFHFSHVVPSHYRTFPLLDQTPEAFAAGLEGSGITLLAPKPGGSVEIG